ncbi:membrane protein [Paenibacillus swuensis]|uniref:Membrane protein n=1 Tax=Paenibacillus swuensis TaxID=1178515 RepID=A0A172TQ45_9BACL|nr:membrane protein [Paenibacillus swuensis]
MFPILSLALLALAVSMDGFGVGVMYGLRKIRIPLLSIIIISVCSGLIIFISMQVGVLVLQWITPMTAEVVGASILLGLGVWSLIQMSMQKTDDIQPAAGPPTPAGDVDAEKQTVLHVELKRLGIIIQILRKPSVADIDRSGNISASEATLLGIALSLDALGAGIGAALVGFHPIITSGLIALASGTFIYCGLRVGFIFSDAAWIRRISFIPGCILILMGLLKLM